MANAAGLAAPRTVPCGLTGLASMAHSGGRGRVLESCRRPSPTRPLRCGRRNRKCLRRTRNLPRLRSPRKPVFRMGIQTSTLNGCPRETRPMEPYPHPPSFRSHRRRSPRSRPNCPPRSRPPLKSRSCPQQKKICSTRLLSNAAAASRWPNSSSRPSAASNSGRRHCVSRPSDGSRSVPRQAQWQAQWPASQASHRLCARSRTLSRPRRLPSASTRCDSRLALKPLLAWRPLSALC